MSARKKHGSRATEMIGRWSFRIAAFLFGFSALQWFIFGGNRLGQQVVIPAAFLTILDAFVLTVALILAVFASISQIRSKNIFWHPFAATLLAGSAFVIAYATWQSVFRW